jgi:hypothetical protein
MAGQKGGEVRTPPLSYGNRWETQRLRREKLKNPRLVSDYEALNT